MKAENNDSSCSASLRYAQYKWGDMIEGTKEQLQALGLGIGLAFPGELSGLRTKLKVRDPRGYPVEITKNSRSDDIYCARLTFPNWPKMPSEYLTETSSGGVRKREHVMFDEYLGSAEALAAADLVRVEHLPGQPGMRKMRVTILADGTTVSGAPTANHREAKTPGSRWIERCSASSYLVRVNITIEESSRRRTISRHAELAWERQVETMKRPARLQPMAQSEWARLKAAQANAARDVAFQGMLSRIVSASGRPST